MTFYPVRFFTLLVALMALAIPRAFSFEIPDNPVFKPTPITRFCLIEKTFNDAIAAYTEKGDKEAVEVFDRAIQADECVILPPMFAITFTGEEIVRRYSKGMEGPEVIVRGKSSTGEDIYIWIDTTELERYLIPGQGA